MGVKMQDKICRTCGRRMTWRKKWEKNWDQVTFCSDSCRKNKIKPDSLDTSFESKILSLLSQRRALQGTAAVVTCEEAEEGALEEFQSKSKEEELNEDAQGELYESKKPERTRERCRQAARRLAARGEILITQEGKVVDPSFVKGVMELKLPS